MSSSEESHPQYCFIASHSTSLPLHSTIPPAGLLFHLPSLLFHLPGRIPPSIISPPLSTIRPCGDADEFNPFPGVLSSDIIGMFRVWEMFARYNLGDDPNKLLVYELCLVFFCACSFRRVSRGEIATARPVVSRPRRPALSFLFRDCGGLSFCCYGG